LPASFSLGLGPTAEYSDGLLAPAFSCRNGGRRIVMASAAGTEVLRPAENHDVSSVPRDGRVDRPKRAASGPDRTPPNETSQSKEKQR
jgi:hypothetical protein